MPNSFANMATIWILLLTLLVSCKYGEQAAIRWVLPGSSNTTTNPPSLLPFAIIKPNEARRIIAVPVDNTSIIDVSGTDCSDSESMVNNPLNKNHSILKMKFVTSNVCAITLKDAVPVEYAPSVAGTVKDTESSKLLPIRYYLVQPRNIFIPVSVYLKAGAILANFPRSGDLGKYFMAECNKPDFNGNLKYNFAQDKILLAEPINTRMESGWGDIVCLLKLIKHDGKTEYAIGEVQLIPPNYADITEQTPPTCPSNNTALLDLNFARSRNSTEDIDVVSMKRLATDANSDFIVYSVSKVDRHSFRFEKNTDHLKLRSAAVDSFPDGTYEMTYQVTDSKTSPVVCVLSIRIGPEKLQCLSKT